MKQDHKTYSRSQVDFLLKQEGLRATKQCANDYAVAIVMCLYGVLNLNKEEIQNFIFASESVFDSIMQGSLTYQDCIEDIEINTGIKIA